MIFKIVNISVQLSFINTMKGIEGVKHLRPKITLLSREIGIYFYHGCDKWKVNSLQIQKGHPYYHQEPNSWIVWGSSDNLVTVSLLI